MKMRQYSQGLKFSIRIVGKGQTARSPRRIYGPSQRAAEVAWGNSKRKPQFALNYYLRHNSIAERIIFVTIAYIFHNFDLSFDNMNEEIGRLNGLLQLFPPKRSRGPIYWL